MEVTCLPEIDDEIMETIIAENVEIVETAEFMEDIDFPLSDQYSPDSTSSPTTPLLPPCRVCGEKASGFHYGANTCEACKGFFRRSLVKTEKNQEDYKCSNNGNCKIQPGRRSACASCRYKKCLSVGMSKQAIKTGRYTYEKRTRDTNEVKKLQGIIIDPTCRPPDSTMTIEDAEILLIISTLTDIQRRIDPEFTKYFDTEYTLQKQKTLYEDYMQRIDVFGNLSVIPNEIYDEFYNETGIDLDNRKKIMKDIAQKMELSLTNLVEFLKSLPGLELICINDQSKLIKAGHFEFWFLVQHKLINTDLNVFYGSVSMHKDEFQSIFSKPHVIEEMFTLAKKFQTLHLTEEEVALVRGIALTFTDRCILEEPHKVEMIQWRLINCLRWLSKKNNHNPEQRLCRILDRLTALRNLTEMSSEINKEKMKWPVMQNHPLVLDVIS